MVTRKSNASSNQIALLIRKSVPNTVTDDAVICQRVADDLSVDVRYVTYVLAGQRSLNSKSIPPGHPLKSYAFALEERVRQTKNQRTQARRQTRKHQYDLHSKQNGRCCYCNKLFSDKFPQTVDHKIPLCRGGDSSLSNLQLLCNACNSIKSFRTDEEFLLNQEVDWKDCTLTIKDKIRKDFGIKFNCEQTKNENTKSERVGENNQGDHT